MTGTMSAIGPKRTLATAPHKSAFVGKADMTFCIANVGLGAIAFARAIICRSGLAPKGLLQSSLHLFADPPTSQPHCRLDAIVDGGYDTAAL